MSGDERERVSDGSQRKGSQKPAARRNQAHDVSEDDERRSKRRRARAHEDESKQSPVRMMPGGPFYSAGK